MDEYSEEDYEKERRRMKRLSPFMVIEYIRTTIEILLSHRLEHKGQKTSSAPGSCDYETLLRQMEGESREHIAVCARCMSSLNSS